MKKIKILGVPISKVTMNEAVELVDGFMKSDAFHTVITPNPEIVMLAKENKAFFEVIQKADLVVPDGIGVVIGSKMQKGENLPERVAGFDLVQNTMKRAAKEGYKYYFLGSKPGVAEKAAEEMRKTYPGIQIVGARDGYFKEEEDLKIVDEINESGANILLVALGAPKQELWMEKYKSIMPNVRVAIGVGGSLDVMAGEVKRAPLAYQKLGLEWFYRLIKQPSRFVRMLVLPKFLIEVFLYKDKEEK